MQYYPLLADFEELGLLFGNAILAGYALCLLIALGFRAFRSWIAILIAGVVAAAASFPVVQEYLHISQYPNVMKRMSVTGLLRWTIPLLLFVWIAPLIQYVSIRALARLRSNRFPTQDNGPGKELRPF